MLSSEFKFTSEAIILGVGNIWYLKFVEDDKFILWFVFKFFSNNSFEILKNFG